MNYSILDLNTLKDMRDAKLRLHKKHLKLSPNYVDQHLEDLDKINYVIKLKERRKK